MRLQIDHLVEQLVAHRWHDFNWPPVINSSTAANPDPLWFGDLLLLSCPQLSTSLLFLQLTAEIISCCVSVDFLWTLLGWVPHTLKTSGLLALMAIYRICESNCNCASENISWSWQTSWQWNSTGREYCLFLIVTAKVPSNLISTYFWKCFLSLYSECLSHYRKSQDMKCVTISGTLTTAWSGKVSALARKIVLDHNTSVRLFPPPHPLPPHTHTPHPQPLFSVNIYVLLKLQQ